MNNIQTTGIAILASALSFVSGYYIDKTDSEDFHHDTKEYKTTQVQNKTTIVLHHFAADITAEQAANFHINGRNWAGLGYHYAIEENGLIKQAHYPNVISYHTGGHNTYTIGIALAGDKSQEPLTQAQFNSLVELIKSLKITLPNIKAVKAHSDFSATECPSDNVRKYIPQLNELVQ